MHGRRPLHERLADELRRRVVDGELVVGEALPSEAQLGQEFGASRGTVRQALAALRAESLISGGRGRPPVVRERVAGQPFATLLSFSRWAELIGRRPGQRTIEIARRGAQEEAADALGLAVGAPVVQLLRLRLLEGEPAMVERTTFVEGVGRFLFDFDLDSGSIYAHLIDRGVDLDFATHTFDAVAADETDAELLDLAPGAPLLRERRCTTTAAGEPVEWSDDRYRPDVAVFTVTNSLDARLRLRREPVAAASGRHHRHHRVRSES